MSRIRRLAYSIAIGMALFLLASSVYASPQEWLLEQQQESNYFKVWLTEKAIAIETKPMGCRFVVKAPDYKVHCFRSKENVEWVGEIADFNSIVLTSPWASIDPKQEKEKMLKDASIKRIKAGESQICGLRCSKYIIKRTEIYACDDIAVSSPLLDFYKRLVFCPRLNSLPLRCYIYARGREWQRPSKSLSYQYDEHMLTDLRNGKLLRLDTMSCKKIPYNPRDFDVPVGLKRKVDLIEVSYSPGQREQIESMMDNMVFESKTARSSSKNRK